MNLNPLPPLPRVPERSSWFRAVSLKYLETALNSSHTSITSSRFSSGSILIPSHEIVYLAKTPELALYEVGAMLGTPFKPGSSVPHLHLSIAILSVQVQLQHVADLTDVPAAQIPLETTAQELTGDWIGYSTRGWNTTVKHPTGPAPTQLLGAALFQCGLYEAFRTPSAKIPHEEVLAIFPERLAPGSFIEYTYYDAAGNPQLYRLP
jgi:hypothetical protein